MKKLYFFFDMEYESITHAPGLPFRVILESIGFIGPHWHSEMEILFVLKGCISVTNSRGRFTLSPGDIMIVNHNEMHSLVEIEDNIILVCQIPSDLLNAGNSGIMLDYFLPEENNKAPMCLSSLQENLARIWWEKQQSRPGYESFCLSYLHHFLGSLKRFIPNRPAVQDPGTDTFRKDRIKRIMDYLHENHKERITLQQLGEEFHASPNYLSHMIKRETGYSFQENLTLIRTGKAVDLLMSTGKSLLEISLEAGFSDPKYFNQAFKKRFGMTPKQLRKKPDWDTALLKHFENDGLTFKEGEPFISDYLIQRGKRKE